MTQRTAGVLERTLRDFELSIGVIFFCRIELLASQNMYVAPKSEVLGVDIGGNGSPVENDW